MNSIFSRMLETIWLIVGLVAVYAAISSFARHDPKNGWIMALVGLIGFLMFIARRAIRLRRKNEKN